MTGTIIRDFTSFFFYSTTKSMRFALCDVESRAIYFFLRDGVTSRFFRQDTIDLTRKN